MGGFDVLFVDDEVDLLDTVVKRIQKRNVNAYGAKNGEEALALLKQRPMDVVVLDVRMPGMDCIGAESRSRGLEKRNCAGNIGNGKRGVS